MLGKVFLVAEDSLFHDSEISKKQREERPWKERWKRGRGRIFHELRNIYYIKSNKNKKA